MKQRITATILTLVLAIGLLLLPATPAAAMSHASSAISTGQFVTFAIKEDGSLWGWGNHNHVGVGKGKDFSNIGIPTKIMEDVISVATGEYRTFAIKSDYSLWGWGSAIGDGVDEIRYFPTKVMDGVTAVAASDTHTMIIKMDGSLWGWGGNRYAQLGNATTTDEKNPVKIMDDVKSVSIGSGYTMALKTDGSLWSWGANSYAVLGNATTTDSKTPIKIMENVAAVSTGWLHATALKTDGSVWAWGKNYNDTAIGAYLDNPTKIMEGVAAVSAGYDHTMAIKNDGSLWAWGAKDCGQIGDGSGNDLQDIFNPAAPTKIMENVKLISAGFRYSVAVKADGSLWIWGRNHGAEIGKDDQWNLPAKIMDNIMIPGSVPTVEKKVSDWAKEEIDEANAMGLIPEGLQDADLTKPITRAEFAAVSVKTYEALSGTAAMPALNSPFTDTSDIEVIKAYNLGITTGVSDNEFEPNTLLNREQAATMLTRVFKRVAMVGWTIKTDADFPLTYDSVDVFADDANISDWARDSVYFMVSNGIIKGVGNNKFAPKNITNDDEARGYANATREQAIIIAVRMVKNSK